jgi:Mce-associated membrane protein
VLVAVVFATMWAPLYSEARERDEVRLAATELALRLTTFDGENIEEWVSEMQDLSTGEYSEQITTIFDQNLRDALREADAVSRGEVVDDNLFVQSLDGDEARVFAVVRQTIANEELEDPVQDELRMQIDMTLVDGEWLTSDVSVLGPGGLAVPSAEGEELE